MKNVMKNHLNNKSSSLIWYAPYKNPEEYFKKHIPQGYNKFIAYIEELRRNEWFKKDFKEIVKMFKNKINEKKREKAIFKFLTKYNIHWGTFEGLGYIKEEEKFDWGWMFPNIYNHDMCIVEDVYGSSYKWKTLKDGTKIKRGFSSPIEYFNTTKNIKLVDKSFRQLYPITISIHKFASKRDVLDYIEKEWEGIKELLSFYKEKPYKPRKRKLDWKIIDYIWENRNLSGKKIQKIIIEKFPNVSKAELMDYEIRKIISLEKKRRNKKNIVGQ